MIAMNRGIVQWVDPYMVRREIGTELGGVLGFGFSPRALREAYLQQYLGQLRQVLKARPGPGSVARLRPRQQRNRNIEEVQKVLQPSDRICCRD